MAAFLQTRTRCFSADLSGVSALDFIAKMGKTDALRMHRLGELRPLIPMATVTRLSDHRKRRRVFFSRAELDQLLQLYSRQVMRGAWRDYAIDQHDGTASFSIFRHSLESPLFTIVKTAPNASRHDSYALLHRRVPLANGGTLQDVLTRLEREIRRGGRLAGASVVQALS
ncbi:MAG: DUF2794 domain-containing protein [Alphaproteobacteria bacterium]|nr:DUF2794 domain-containing protein [Alphaproteobacteria bacterium]